MGKLFKILFLVSSIAGAPQSSFPRIDVARFVDKVQKENYPTDNRVKVAISSKSPAALNAQLARMGVPAGQPAHMAALARVEQQQAEIIAIQKSLFYARTVTTQPAESKLRNKCAVQ